MDKIAKAAVNLLRKITTFTWHVSKNTSSNNAKSIYTKLINIYNLEREFYFLHELSTNDYNVIPS